MNWQDSSTDTIYKRTRISTIVFLQLHTVSSMIFFTLVSLISYLANEGYGITVVVSGLILTGTRVFDGLIDPVIALTIDRFHSRFGKIRIGLALGWLIRAIAIYLLFVSGSNHQLGIVYFVVIYLLFIIGSSLADINAGS